MNIALAVCVPSSEGSSMRTIRGACKEGSGVYKGRVYGGLVAMLGEIPEVVEKSMLKEVFKKFVAKL